MESTFEKIVDLVGNFKTSLDSCDNETQKKELFIVLMAQLFPTKAQHIRQLAKGAEEYTKYAVDFISDDSKYGFIDTLFGQLIIEFEYDLKKTGTHAEQQLREYVAKLWSSQEVKTDYVCISSDGISWKIFTPKLIQTGLTSNQIPSKNIELIVNEPYTLTNDFEGFYFWLDRIFFRENRVSPQSKVICSEFGSESPHFAKTLNGLMTIFNQAKEMKEVKIALENWRKYLKYTYGDIEASDELFVTHTYLSGFIKLLMANFFSASRKTSFSEEQISQALTGKFFYDLNVRNYVEKDFFYWINFKEFSGLLEKNWQSTFGLLKAYDFSSIGNDFLKDIYQGMVDPENRHDLGEHYTPDWLCEKIVAEALEKWTEKDAPRIADITCGSGSFLRIAIKLIRKKFYSKTREQNKVISAITKKVIGFEIHPLAAFIAKTNYMLAMEDLLPEAEEPFNIPIYLCDSLLNSELDKMDFEKRMKFAVQLAGKKFELPIIESLSDDRFDNLIDYIDDLTHNYSKKDLTESKIKELISKKISGYLSKAAPEYDELLNSTVNLTMALHEKVLNHENTIWSFVLKNNFRPIVFNKTIDIVVGNPPWLTFKDVKSDDYRKELEDLGLRQHKIAPMSGKLRTHMELATIFLTHAVDSYLKENGNLYFVLPRSLFSADHHSNFREQTYTLDMKVEEIWDLFDVSPLFRVPSCVVVASHNKKSSAKKYNGRILKAKFPEQNVSYEKAASLLNEKVKDFYCVRMGSWSALSEKNISIQSQDKFYQDKFKQGATLLPRSFYFVETSGRSHAKKKSVPIKTATSAKKNAKKPYHKIDMLGRANTKFLFNTLIAENIIPFGVVSPFLVHLPVVKSKTDWNSCTYHKMLEDGYKDSSDWFKDVETSFNKLAKGTMTPFERLNFHNGLLSQNPTQKIWVIYCAAGTNVCASVYFNKEKLFIEHKNYWFCPSSKEEAYYLCGVLNSEFANLLIKPFQTKGLLGERDIEKKILGIGIPQFSKSNKAMIAISKKAETLTRKVESNLLKFNAKSVGKRRSQVREHFKNEFSEIDVLVTSLFTKSK